MSKDIPEIDDLTKGINDSELILTEIPQERRLSKKKIIMQHRKRILLFPFRIQDAGMTSWNSCNRTVRERTKLKGLSASLTVTLRIHWTTAIYMADAALTW